MEREYKLGPDDEDRGLTKEQYDQAQKELRIRTSEYISSMANKPLRLFYIFENHNQQQQALELLKKSEFYDELRQTYNSGIDPERPDIGIRMDFKKTPENFEDKLISLFAKSGMIIKEKYYQEIQPVDKPFKKIKETEPIIQKGTDKILQMKSLKQTKKPDGSEIPKAA